MCRFHFWSQIGLLDGTQNCLRKAKMKTRCRKLSQDCGELWCFWLQILHLREKLRLLGSFWYHYQLLWRVRKQIMFLAKILFLFFANSWIGSGPNRRRILIRHSRKYPRMIGILFFVYLKYTMSATPKLEDFYLNILSRYGAPRRHNYDFITLAGVSEMFGFRRIVSKHIRNGFCSLFDCVLVKF